MGAQSEIKQARRQWSQELKDAEFWIAQARKESARRDYKKSRDAVFMACHILDNACQLGTDEP